ncbi:MAG: PaaI family thioesterase [Pseudomonadota bacterium]
MTSAVDDDLPPPPPGFNPISEEPRSPLLSAIGARFARWEPGLAEVVLEVNPSVVNRQGVVHGGAVMTLIDSSSGYAGCYCPYPGRARHALTLSMTTNFLSGGRAPRLTAIGRVTGGGRSVFFTTSEVFDAAGDLVASGTGVFRYRSDSRTLFGAPRA